MRKTARRMMQNGMDRFGEDQNPSRFESSNEKLDCLIEKRGFEAREHWVLRVQLWTAARGDRICIHPPSFKRERETCRSRLGECS